LATKFTYKMRSGGKGMWGRGPALYKQKLLLLIFENKNIFCCLGTSSNSSRRRSRNCRSLFSPF
jgi:hypothetical protein